MAKLTAAQKSRLEVLKDAAAKALAKPERRVTVSAEFLLELVDLVEDASKVKSTSARVAAIAADVLRDGHADQDEAASLAASVLSQVPAQDDPEPDPA